VLGSRATSSLYFDDLRSISKLFDFIYRKIKLNLKNNFILSAEIQSGPVGASFPFFDPSSSIKTHTRGAMTPGIFKFHTN